MQVHPPRASRKNSVNRGLTPHWRSVCIVQPAGCCVTTVNVLGQGGVYFSTTCSPATPPCDITPHGMPRRSWPVPVEIVVSATSPPFWHARRDAGGLGWHALDGLSQAACATTLWLDCPMGKLPAETRRRDCIGVGEPGFPRRGDVVPSVLAYMKYLQPPFPHPPRPPPSLPHAAHFFPPPPRAARDYIGTAAQKAGGFCRPGLVGRSTAGGSSRCSPGWPGEREGGRLAG